MIRSTGARGGDSWRYGAPVFSPYFESNTYSNGDCLPGLWITRPEYDDEGNLLGRNCIDLYPSDLPGPEHADLDGAQALHYGSRYYDEGMSCTDPVDHERRVDCFQAAELLYRHAAVKGNPVAYLNLGYVYSYDRCEGCYWRDPMTLETEEDYRRPYPREERAFECFKIAAEAGIPEACYKLGDMYKHGTGCDPNAAEAFRWYVRASELAKQEQPVILGSIALRLASCYEEGLGCELDFRRALEWYGKAADALEFAVDNGKAWYERALVNARAGAKRCRQEIG